MPNSFHNVRFTDGSRRVVLDNELTLIDDCIDITSTVPIGGGSTTEQFCVDLPQGGGNASLQNVLALRATGVMMEVGVPDPNSPTTGTPPTNPPHDFPAVPEFSFYNYDHLGNTRVLYHNYFVSCTPGGVRYVLEHVLDYYPYGRSLREYTLTRDRFQTTYHERDEESGLDYRGARFYDGDIGVFLSVDPIADHPNLVSWSTYHYTYNNPILFTDPDGRLPIPLITGLIGAAGGLIYGLASGKNWKQTAALTAGGFVMGATLGFGGAGVAALGGIETLGGAGASYIMIGSGVAGGLAGNAVEQGVRIALGESPSFNGEEFAISGAFGMSEVVLGPAGDAAGNAAKNSIKEGLKDAIVQPSRSQLRRTQKEIARQIREQAGPGTITKQQSRQAAKGLVQAAQEQRSATLQGTIRFSENGVDVSVSAMQTTAIEETKSKVLEDGNN